ncbi:MAG TPA: hypothetical protein PKD75_11145, partial [Tepidiformaceae bacterium]|nr:hypothetical protein [Tepidiformaceae bacterium]
WCAAMLNSQVLNFVFRLQDNTFRGGFRTANRQFIDPLPIAPVDRDPSLSARIITLARELHGLKEKQRLTDPADAGRLAQLEHEFKDGDREMEEFVAQAYGLSAGERQLVFGTEVRG